MLLTDWFVSFVSAVAAAFQGQNPYLAIPSFLSPPWTIPILAPFVWLPWWVVLLLPITALLLLAVYRKKPYLIAIVGTSFSFIALTAYGNIDWLVMIGVVVGGPFGILLASVKPQAGALAFVSALRGKTRREIIIFLAPIVVVTIIGTLLYPNWIGHMFTVRGSGATRSLSLFPFSIPFGLLALWQSWRKHDPLWGVVGTLCLSPYLYIHSLTPFIFLAADRDWRLGLLGNLATWLIVGLTLAGVLKLVF